MNKSVQWLKEAEEEDILLSLIKECLLVDEYGMTIIAGMKESGKTNLVKQIIRYNSENDHKIDLVCSTIDLKTEYDCLPMTFLWFKT